MRLMAGIRMRGWPLWALLVSACLMPSDISMAQFEGRGIKKASFDKGSPADKAEVGIALDQQMDFGQVADNDGSIILGLADTITSDPDFIHYGGTPYSAICTITGDPDTGVDVSISSAGSNGLSLGDFTSSEGAIPLINVNLDPSGELVLTIGATLTVDETNASVGPGQSISYTITTTYN
jgi:hypothetical protein